MLTDFEECHKTVFIIFTYSWVQTGSSTGYHNIQEDLPLSCVGHLCPSRAAKHEVKQQACPTMLQSLTWTSSTAHRKWHKQGGPREESHQRWWWATLWMLLDLCGCGGGSGCRGEETELGCEGGCLGGWSVHTTALSGWFSYDSWCPRAAQQQGIGSPGLQTNDDEEITLKDNLHNISCSLGSLQAARAARLTALSIDLIHCRSYSSHIVFQINDTADRNDIYININPEKK